MNYQFKILGLRPLEGCAPHIRKILKTNTTYFFYNDYEDDPDRENQIKKRKKGTYSKIPGEFFSGNQDTVISVSAIVGKNGEGKSSLVELLIRVMNNFAYAVSFSDVHRGLCPVSGVYAILYYSINNKVHSIQCTGDEVRVSWNKRPFLLSSPETGFDRITNHEQRLFFTEVINYSLYAYNSLDIKEEYSGKNCWIEGVFHKNDAYQTPIVLNPYRSQGNIDVNNEHYLANQRLMSLMIEGGADNAFRKVSNNGKAKYITVKPFENSKLYDKTIKEYFYEVAYFNKLDPLETDLNKYEKSKDKIKDPLSNKAYHKVLKDIFKIIKTHEEDYEKALELLKDVHKDLKDKIGKGEGSLDALKSDFSKLVTLFNRYFPNDWDCNYLFSKEFHLLNILQIQRIALIICVKDIWVDMLGTDFENGFYENSLNGKLRQYIVYKTISILEKYPQFHKKPIDILSDYHSLFNYDYSLDSIRNIVAENFVILNKDLQESKSHITLKLRQSLQYYRLNPLFHYINQDDRHRNLPDIPENLPVTDLDTYKRRIESIIHKQNKKGLLIIELLPPPIFDTQIIIVHDSTDSCSFFHQLSSGEKQFLYTTSSIIYHLKNINSTLQSSNIVKYRFVNLILEEVELYFHPEYQRQFVKSLIDRIKASNISDIKAVNILFVTHSPFILSDIPKNNVLFLEDGRPTFKMKENTFGANIHTLLQNGFFLDSVPIGDFAKEKINFFLSILHEGKTCYADKEGKHMDLYDQIMLVSEPFIKTQLLKLYNERIDGSIIRQLVERIERLEKRI